MATVNRDRTYDIPDDLMEWVVLDEDNLVQEWVSHSARYYKIAVKLAKMKTQLAEAKSSLELCMAIESDKLRSNPEKYGLKKTTDPAIKAAALRSKNYQAAEESYNVIKAEVDELGAFIESMDHRKKALENITYLHHQNYNSEPQDKSKNKEATDYIKRQAAYESSKVKLNRR